MGRAHCPELGRSGMSEASRESHGWDVVLAGGSQWLEHWPVH